ncbi:Endothelin-converting enzyme 2 [Mortierella alpina]|nr:Endothelin-converting enzyme 2 [Mortierella alpina]
MRLPGLDSLTFEQLFFIQFGRFWCSKKKPKAEVELLTNEHSSSQWRINGVAQNSEYFSKAFNCKPGTPMSPIKSLTRELPFNSVRSIAWETSITFRLLNKPVDKRRIIGFPGAVNAYYSPLMNSIVLPAGILSPPFFHVDHPEYLNYAGIGMVTGHEIGHAFDNEGRKFDSTGRLVNWWSKSSLKVFNRKAQCFVRQYNNFTVQGPGGKSHHVDGARTLGENIADNAGLKKAYEAWQTQFQSDPMSKTHNNKRLPGLDSFTFEQLFFIQFGRVWCSKTKPETDVGLLADEHSPAKWRINGVAKNSKYFAKAFNCKPGTPMNPIKKCDLF